jgi:hypothetical protein
MALPFDVGGKSRDPRAFPILAKTIYRELRAEGYSAREVMALASELLELVASEVKEGRVAPESRESSPARSAPPAEIRS